MIWTWNVGPSDDVDTRIPQNTNVVISTEVYEESGYVTYDRDCVSWRNEDTRKREDWLVSWKPADPNLSKQRALRRIESLR